MKQAPADLRLSLKQVAHRIKMNGRRKTYLVKGGMGTGKSSLLKMMEAILGDEYEYVMVDCTQINVGDVTIPAVDYEKHIFSQLPNVMFIGTGKPLVICLDEIAKCADSVQAVLCPVAMERRAGIHKMHPMNYIFATTNLSEEGVGDRMKAHVRQRFTIVETRNPNTEEWIADFGIPNNLHPALLLWVKENPNLFQSFKDCPDPADNPYIYHPKASREAFVTPRSLYQANMELCDEDGNPHPIDDYQATLACIAGNIGVRAACDLMAAVEVGERMPLWGAILADPENVDLPNDPAVLMMAVFRCVSRVEEHTLNLVMKFVARFPVEVQTIFINRLMSTPSKSKYARLNTVVNAWFKKHNYLINRHA